MLLGSTTRSYRKARPSPLKVKHRWGSSSRTVKLTFLKTVKTKEDQKLLRSRRKTSRKKKAEKKSKKAPAPRSLSAFATARTLMKTSLWLLVICVISGFIVLVLGYWFDSGSFSRKIVTSSGFVHSAEMPWRRAMWEILLTSLWHKVRWFLFKILGPIQCALITEKKTRLPSNKSKWMPIKSLKNGNYACKSCTTRWKTNTTRLRKWSTPNLTGKLIK